MIIKAQFNQGRLVLAVCDKEIFNKKFVDGDLQLDLTSDFYRGEERTQQETITLMKEAYIVNAVGKKAVDCCIKAGIIDKNNIKRIKNTPYAYMVRF